MPGTLTHSPADITRYLLVASGYGTLPSASGSWPIHVSQLPSTPDSVMLVKGTANVHQGRVHIDGEVQERHGIQILVRGIPYTAVHTKSNLVAIALDEDVYDTEVTIGS